MGIRTLDIQTLLDRRDGLESYRLFDARSPSEFKADHLPGAENHPVLNDEERARVGTIYTQESTFLARELGARLISANIPGILETMDPAAVRGTDFLVYCWRGGMRSRSLATVMDMIGYKTNLVDGGYRAYRRAVARCLGSPFPFRLGDDSIGSEIIAIHGYTGSGKTRLLKNLEARGAAVVDLENLARHRGSMLGSFPGAQPTQKSFESGIFAALRKLRSGTILVEGESRSIGQLMIPDGFYHAMTAGRKIWIDLPLAVRVRQCLEDYAEDPPVIRAKLSLFKGRMANADLALTAEYLDAGRLEAAAEILLEKYYDPLYRRHGPEANPDRYTEVIRADSLDQAETILCDFLKNMCGMQIRTGAPSAAIHNKGYDAK